MKKINTLCVIDDDDIYTFTIKRIIAKAEVAEKTIFFHNGRVAIDFICNCMEVIANLPDMILLDLNMPVLDGWQFLDEFIKLVPRLGKKILIYIVSSSIDEDDFKRAKEMELVSDFIVKPLNAIDLRNIVDQWV
ncbi:response regulator [Mucilaginibacter sp. OK283]|jgi:CheY-like chemotaxis protein|uniref:response regulator n=1 Tax=Mucilaginibacter sp. OK283 TaxID=1881049 RepID=UPI0008CE66EA|nr:response regulator [Mucilaginibacter sp. OK283]SEP42505.1 Response regulator receiver domain-containing protein [Mucilaginibacter sp. OK283]